MNPTVNLEILVIDRSGRIEIINSRYHTLEIHTLKIKHILTVVHGDEIPKRVYDGLLYFGDEESSGSITLGDKLPRLPVLIEKEFDGDRFLQLSHFLLLKKELELMGKVTSLNRVVTSEIISQFLVATENYLQIREGVKVSSIPESRYVLLYNCEVSGDVPPSVWGLTVRGGKVSSLKGGEYSHLNLIHCEVKCPEVQFPAELDTLNIIMCDIEIDHCSFEGCEELTFLRVIESGLTDIPIVSAPNLYELDISQNPIYSMDLDEAMRNYPKLRNLVLGRGSGVVKIGTSPQNIVVRSDGWRIVGSSPNVFVIDYDAETGNYGL